MQRYAYPVPMLPACAICEPSVELYGAGAVVLPLEWPGFQSIGPEALGAILTAR